MKWSRGCPPIPNVYANKLFWCPSIVAAAIEYIDRDDVETVVIGANWNNYLLNATRKQIDQEANQADPHHQAILQLTSFRRSPGSGN